MDQNNEVFRIDYTKFFGNNTVENTLYCTDFNRDKNTLILYNVSHKIDILDHIEKTLFKCYISLNNTIVYVGVVRNE